MNDDIRRIRYLCHSLFNDNEQGKELLERLKQDDMKQQVFPMDPHVLAQYGGAVGYFNFREGHRALIRYIEMMAQAHADEMEAYQKQQ